jgi:hypothetical protein
MREGRRRCGGSKSGVPRGGHRRGSGQMEPRGDENVDGGSVPVASCVNKGAKWRSHRDRGRNGGNRGPRHTALRREGGVDRHVALQRRGARRPGTVEAGVDRANGAPCTVVRYREEVGGAWAVVGGSWAGLR